MKKIYYYHSTQYYSFSRYLYETKCKKSSDILCETIATVGMPQTFKNLLFPTNLKHAHIWKKTKKKTISADNEKLQMICKDYIL